LQAANGPVIFVSIYTDQLWVQPAHRKNDLGHKIMEAIHDDGRKSGCLTVTVATMSFQGAKTLYKKLEYVTDFGRPGYTQNSSFIFLKRSL
jgi:GNAT superfamily N-acetyltransferase